jgi:hypothetical protein
MPEILSTWSEKDPDPDSFELNAPRVLKTAVVAVPVQLRDSYLIPVEADDGGVPVELCLAKNNAMHPSTTGPPVGHYAEGF